MKRIISFALALGLTVTMAGATCVEDMDTAVQTYGMPQPINREILQRDQMPTQQPQNGQAVESQSVYNDPYLSYQWAITETGADLTWEAVSQDGASIVVAVVDSGVDYTHEDLENRVLVDLGYDFVNDDDDPMDDNGHGTHVSGIIAAEADNGVGIAGMAGTLDVSILPIKVLNSEGAGETADITAGILYAVDMGVDVLNLSLGADVITPDVRDAIETALEADIFVVVAAGNDGTVCAPLSLANLNGVFTVAAATESNTVADFSNYGDCIDGYAPGEDILSTYLDNQYAYQDGTSMAAPIVSGAAAVILSQNSDLTNAELTSLLSTTATSTTSNVQTVNNTPMAPNVQTKPISMPTMRSQALQMLIQYSPMSFNTMTCTTVNVYEALMNMG
ncbi:MAG: S8 family serine peptidase [Eubacteriales bacterium]